MSNRPVTKKEQYLAKAAGITSGTTPPAVTREEHFLKAIADGTGYKSLPTAITKEEQYLKAMTGAPIGNAFYVWHSSVKGGGTNGMPERVFITDEILENGYDLTSHLPYGTLYGGYAKIEDVTMDEEPDNLQGNWYWSKQESASGQTLIPIPGQIYVVKEMPWGWMKISGAYSASGGVIRWIYPFSVIEENNYHDDVGFYINGVKTQYYGCYKTYKIAGHTYTVPEMFGSYGLENGYLVINRITDPAEGDIYTLKPYLTTCDGIEVRGTQTQITIVRSTAFASDSIEVRQIDINPPYVPEEPEEEPEENET